MIAAASECRVSLPPVIEYDADRADLPLVVVPVSIPSMTTLLKERLEAFAGLARVRLHTDWTDDENVLASRMAGATVVMSTGFRAPASLLERIAPGVRCITFCGTGAVSFIDLEAARRLGITICNAVHYGDNAVAEHAIALMFEHTHRVGELNARTHQGGCPARTSRNCPAGRSASSASAASDAAWPGSPTGSACACWSGTATPTPRRSPP